MLEYARRKCPVQVSVQLPLKSTRSFCILARAFCRSCAFCTFSAFHAFCMAHSVRAASVFFCQSSSSFNSASIASTLAANSPAERIRRSRFISRCSALCTLASRKPLIFFRLRRLRFRPGPASRAFSPAGSHSRRRTSTGRDPPCNKMDHIEDLLTRTPRNPGDPTLGRPGSEGFTSPPTNSASGGAVCLFPWTPVFRPLVGPPRR